MGSDNILTFESMFDDRNTIRPELFKEEVLKKIQMTGHIVEVSGGTDNFSVKVMDPHRSRGYNVFKSNEEYNGWLGESLYEPTQEEVQEALSGTRS